MTQQSPFFSTNTEKLQLDRQSSSASSNPPETGTAPKDERVVTKDQLVGGAAVAGGLAGLVLMGPVVGLLAAGGAAFAASTNKGKAGQLARATGEVTVQAGRRLERFEKKHHVVEKTSKSVVKGCHWVSDRLQPQQNHFGSTDGTAPLRSSRVGRDSNVQAALMT